MPKMHPYRTRGPDVKRDIWWAIGVFEGAGRVYIHRKHGKISGTRIWARVPPDTGIAMQKLLGGSYSGARWYVPPPEQATVALLLSQYIEDQHLWEQLQAVLAYRRTLGRSGVPLDPHIHDYRERIAQRARRAEKGPASKDRIKPPNEE